MVLLTTDCTCKPGEEYAHGGKAEFFTDFRKTVECFIQHKKNFSLYFGVHYKGKHIMTVRAVALNPVNCDVVTQ